MTNDTSTKKTFDPKWYMFWARNQKTIYCWFNTYQDAEKYEELLNAGKNKYSNLLYTGCPLDAVHFREIAEKQAHIGDLPLSDDDCETIAYEWLQKIYIMTSEGLFEAGQYEAICKARYEARKRAR
jgi:hypothetical protein